MTCKQMHEPAPDRRAGCKRARTGAGAVTLRALLLVLLAAGPHVPSSDALKLASISEESGHLGVGLLRAVEVVRGRYERAWALISAAEPTAEELETALELLQANAKQWESLEPAVKLWTERDSSHEAPRHNRSGGAKSAESTKTSEHRSSPGATTAAASGSGGSNSEQQQQQDERAPGAPGASDTASHVYEEAASLLAHNRAVLGQALARSGHTDRGIAELEVACPEILEYQQNAQGRRDSKSWLHCYANLAEMYKAQKRFEEASSLLARMPWLPSPQGTGAGSSSDNADSPESPTASDGDGDKTPTSPLSTDQSVSDRGDPTENGRSEGGGAGEGADPKASKPPPRGEGKNTTAVGPSGETAADADAATPPSKGSGSGGGGGGRSEAPPARGAGAARVAGLNKAAAAASAAAAAEMAAAAAGAVETGAEAAARAVMERHAEAMRASMNELVGELAVTTATRPSASQDWLDSRVAAAEEVLAAVRSGLLVIGGTSEQTGGTGAAADTTAAVPAMVVGAPGHADILREASHYLSAIKGVAAQGWAYVDNELHRMERHPAQAVKPGFQNRREVIHTFRYLLMKARQYASENQTQASRSSSGSTSTSSAGSGSRWRRKDRGRKASASSKAPRKGGAARGTSSRSDGDSSSQDGDGLLTLFVGAGIALLVAAVSSGGSRGHGRRRDVVRQRTATRAAKTVGSYVEPPQRTAVAALLLHVWGNLKRSGLLVSSHAITTANMARALLFTAWASGLDRIRAARDSDRSKRAIGGGKTSVASLKKSASASPGGNGSGNGGGNKQRSKKNAKKASGAPPRLLVRGDTAIVTPPASPPAAAPAVAQTAGTHLPAARPAEKTAAVASSVHKPRTTDVVGASDSVASSNGEADAGRPVLSAVSGGAATATATEKTTGVPFLDVMTAEQVQAMVEEDERAWEQARQGDKLHIKADAAAAKTAAPTVAKRALDAEGAGWSEVGAGGSRGRAGGAPRGRVLSIRNVRAAAQAARTSSPGSDPATTTSASSSDSGEGCKEKPSRGGGRATGRTGGGRAVHGGVKSSAAPRAGNKSTWAAASDAGSRGGGGPVRPQHGSRGPAQARVAPPARDSELATSRPSRTPHAPWATAARNGGAATVATAQTLRGGEKPGVALRSAAVVVAEPSPSPRGPTVPERRPAATVERSQPASSLRQPLQPETTAPVGSGKVVSGDKNKEDAQLPASAPPAPAAWTNTPSHPLGMQPEPAPLPPASEPPRPPPQHQQHWQRQQQREQQQQHFFHQQERRMMPVSAVPMHQHQDVGSHHYPPLSLPPQPHQHHRHHHHQPPPQTQPQQQHDVAMPQFIPATDEAFPPPLAHMPIPATNVPPPNAPAVIYPSHPTHIATIPSPGVSPGGERVVNGDPHLHTRDGSYDSPGSAGAGFSPDGGAVLAHSQVMVLPPPYEQQQQQQQVDRFSPLTLQVVPVEEGDGSDGGEAFEALMGALRWQVEYYFSADNLVTDAYLRGLMDPEGFVAVSKIIVFNRVRRMTSDCALLIAAMRRSSELEIMEQDHLGETRVRTRHSPLHWTREQPLPPSKAPSPIPEEEPEHESLDEDDEEVEHHITFGNVAEVIGQDEPASVAAEVVGSQE